MLACTSHFLAVNKQSNVRRSVYFCYFCFAYACVSSQSTSKLDVNNSEHARTTSIRVNFLRIQTTWVGLSIGGGRKRVSTMQHGINKCWHEITFERIVDVNRLWKRALHTQQTVATTWPVTWPGNTIALSVYCSVSVQLPFCSHAVRTFVCVVGPIAVETM